jgi:uncharacterized protein (DUF433 family)
VLIPPRSGGNFYFTIIGVILHGGRVLVQLVSMAERIEINSDVMQGKPVIRGTRLPVELLLRKLAEGMTTADLLDAYPRLQEDDIRAALDYAADTIAHETVVTLGSR